MFSKPLRGRPINQRHWAARGLKASWLLNEGCGKIAFDSSGNGNHGTLMHMASPPTATSGWGPGRRGIGLRFDASNDYINPGNDNSLNIFPAFTVAAWIKAPDSATYRVIYSRCGVPSAGQHYHTHLFRFTDTGTIQVYWENPDGTEHLLETTSAYDDDTWRHIAATVDGTVVEIFVDGVSVASDTETAGLPSTSTAIDIRIGALATYTATHVFNGEIEELQIYNRALSAVEIGKLYYGDYAMFNPIFSPGYINSPVVGIPRSYGYIF